MENNGNIDVLGQMKNNFIKPFPRLAKIMDPILETSLDLNEKPTNIGELIPSYRADTNILMETEVENKEISGTSSASLDKLGTDDALPFQTDSFKNIQNEDAKDTELNRTPKRTRRRPNSNSIIQSAIARKEKSFGIYEKPKSKKPQIKAKILAGCKKLGNSDLESVEYVPVRRQSPQKRNKSLQKTAEKNTLVAAEFSDDTTENDSKIRSQRELTSESKCSPRTVSGDEDETTKAQLSSRLCKCTENKQLYMESESDSQFCTAVDSISEKLIGCSRLVNVRDVPMFRPSTRLPFGVFCESHKQRLISHNCCSTCGVFCTQGYFAECQSKHQFHKGCKLFIGKKEYCPHCGDSTPSTDIVITMHSSKKPIFLPVQRSHHNTARINFQETKTTSSSCGNRGENVTPPIVPMEQMEILKNAVYVNMNECNENGLVEAIKNVDLGKVAVILGNKNVDMKVRLADYSNGTFLHLAILKGSIQIAYLLISNHIDIDILDSDQNSPLMLAALQHKNDIIKYLIKAGADIVLKGIDGMTSLHMAAKSGNLEACSIILESGFGIPNFVNLQDDGGWTPLVWACEHGYSSVAKYLISQGADVNISDVEHNVALHWAAFKGSSQIVELLLNLKTDINVLNVHGDTPLHISAREDHYNCVITLLSRKADFSIINKNNETPMECARKDGLCFAPLALNSQLHVATSINSPSKPSLLVNDISRGREINPIQCYNAIDTDEEPKQYTYLKKNCLTSDNVQINMKVTSMQSCSCDDRCKSLECGCAKLSIKCWYDDQGKLLSDFNFFDPPIIFECNDMCSCNAILCTNRLVQKPLAHRFELFKTASKGWGIKSLNFIAMGNYVCEYVGEILTDTEADHREDDSYLFDLDNRESDSFCIDAKNYGNFARFINHSCDPNLHPVKVFIEHHDLRFPRIALFAKRDILSDEELSFDYGDKFWLVKYKSFTCHCRADSCKYSKETIGAALKKYEMTPS